MADKGKVYIVGAGAGGLDLMTIKAHKLISKIADVVIYDRLIADEIIDEIRDGAEKIFAGKEPQLHHMTQDQINDKIVECASQGKSIVRLKGGDPYIFGRGGEEVETLQKNNIEFEIIPGITAAAAAAAEYNIPLTYRKLADGITFISGHAYKDGIPDLDYESLAKTNNTIVIYMGVGNSKAISDKFVESGMDRDKPVALVQEAGSKNSRKIQTTIGNLHEDIEEENIKNPSIIIIGEVVKKSLKNK